MKTIFIFITAITCGAFGDSPPALDPLEVLIRNSTLVIDADIIGEGVHGTGQYGITKYIIQVRCREAVIGEAPPPDIWVTFELATPHPACLHKGQRCILFLRRSKQSEGDPLIQSTDMWFSAQPYSLHLLLWVKEVKDRSQ